MITQLLPELFTLNSANNIQNDAMKKMGVVLVQITCGSSITLFNLKKKKKTADSNTLWLRLVGEFIMG